MWRLLRIVVNAPIVLAQNPPMVNCRHWRILIPVRFQLSQRIDVPTQHEVSYSFIVVTPSSRWTPTATGPGRQTSAAMRASHLLSCTPPGRTRKTTFSLLLLSGCCPQWWRGPCRPLSSPPLQRPQCQRGPCRPLFLCGLLQRRQPQ